MKQLAVVSVLAVLAAGLFLRPATPKPTVRPAFIQRAAWREAQPKHWRAIVLRKNN